MEPIYIDNHLLVVDKPAGISTQPEFHEEMRLFVKGTFLKPGNVFLEPIHRLDRPVGGLLLFARTSKALSRLNLSMREGKIEKVYLGVVEGEVEERGELVHYLLHGDHQAHVVGREHEGAKKAHLFFERLKTDGKNSLVKIFLKTGRYHQIRAQMSAIGHPILGDAKYGSSEKRESLSLIHSQIRFPHPTLHHPLELFSRLELREIRRSEPC